MNPNLTDLTAFLAGAASFLSPCVVPLMPVYLSYLTGVSMEELEHHPSALRRTVFLHSLAFLLGFLIVNALLGLTATGLGRFLAVHAQVFRQVSGVVLILFGLFHAELVRLPGLGRERRFRIRTGAPRFINSVGIGILFSFGWTPCTGAVLGAVLVAAANSLTFWSGVRLLAVYSLGFALPFLVSGLFFNEILRMLPSSDQFFSILKKITGALIALAGLLILTNQLDRFVGLLNFGR